MANNNSQIDLFGGLRKFFGFVERAFTVMDKQYANDGSSKFTVMMGDNTTKITVTCIPSRSRRGDGNMDIKFVTDAQVRNGQDQTLVYNDVRPIEIRDRLDEVIERWFGDKFANTEYKETKTESDTKDKDKDNSKEDTNDNKKDNMKDKQSQQSKDGYEVEQPQPLNVSESARILRFGISRITGSNELQLAKVYANYDPELATDDLRNVIDNYFTMDTGYNDYPDSNLPIPLENTIDYYTLVSEEEDDDYFDLYQTTDFEVPYDEMIDDMLLYLYTISLNRNAFKLMCSNNDCSVFYNADSIVNGLIDYLETLRFKLTGYVKLPTNYEYYEYLDNDLVDFCAFYDLYVMNLTAVLRSLNLTICDFDAETQNTLYSYKNQIEQYIENIDSCMDQMNQ